MNDLARSRHEALRTVGQFIQAAQLCACGGRARLMGLIHVALESYPEPGGPPVDDMTLDEPANLILAYLLDAWDLTDHGSAISYCWLTADGVRLRDALRRLDLPAGDLDDLLPDGGWWIDEHRLYPHGRPGQTAGGSLSGWRHEPVTQAAGNPEVRAPEHIVDHLLAVMRPHRGPSVGSREYALAARAEARAYADRYWTEGWHAGAVWGLARNTQPVRMVIENVDPALLASMAKNTPAAAGEEASPR